MFMWAPFSAAIVPIVIPVLFWAGYHYHKDRHLPEPVGHLVLAYLLGVASFWLGIALYEALGTIGLQHDAYSLAEDHPAGLFVYAVLVIGTIEELVKIIPFVIVILRFREFDEPIDGIIYASFIALGFATIENYSYLAYVTPLEALARGFAGPVVHIVFASVWGFYIGCARLRGEALPLIVLISLAATASLHGLYDFIVIVFPATALPIAGGIVLFLWIWRLQLLKVLHNHAASLRTDTDRSAARID